MDRFWGEKTGSHYNLSACGIKHFMNHVESVESSSMHWATDSVCLSVSGGNVLCTLAHVCVCLCIHVRPIFSHSVLFFCIKQILLQCYSQQKRNTNYHIKTLEVDNFISRMWTSKSINDVWIFQFTTRPSH